MPFVEIKPRALVLMRAMAGEYADLYVEDELLPSLQVAAQSSSPTLDDVKAALTDPFRGLRALYGHYAFARRGKDKHDLAALAIEALNRVVSPETFEQFLRQPHADSLWTAYEDVCRGRSRKPLEQLNRGIIAGLAELAQEIYREDGVGSVVNWIVRSINGSDRVEDEFLRMVDIRGVGPKMTSVFIRDVVFLFGLEERLDPVDRLYVQPIDKWIRLIAPYIIEEPGIAEAADWILAGKLAKYTRRAGVSGVRFNMGTTAFGSGSAHTPQRFHESIREILP